MWDVRRYDDTDYGLDAGETFEPGDAEAEDAVDLASPHIMTVLGPIRPEDLDVCQVHEYILGELDSGSTLAGPRLAPAAEALEAYVTAGGRGMVDVSTRDRGRDVEGLYLLAHRIPVHLIAVTGYGPNRQAAQGGHALDEPAFQTELLSEITHGIGVTGIRPGLIAFATAAAGLSPEAIVAGTAVARVAVETGYPVSTWSESSDLAEDQVDLLERAGMPLDRVIVGHLDRRLDLERIVAIAKRGVWLGFDQVGQEQVGPDRQRAEALVRLADAGYAARLLVSQGVDSTGGGRTPAGQPARIHLLERFTLELMAAGASAELVRSILIENPARALTVHPRPGLAGAGGAV